MTYTIMLCGRNSHYQYHILESLSLFCQELVVFNLDVFTFSFAVDLDQVFEDGSGMLHLALIARNAEAVQFLCQEGIPPKIRDKFGKPRSDPTKWKTTLVSLKVAT